MPTDTKNHKRTEDATADQAKHGDSCSAKGIHAGLPMCPTSFSGNSIDLPALPCCREDTMVDKGAAVLKLCISPVEMRTLTAAGSRYLVAYFLPAQPLQRRGPSSFGTPRRATAVSSK